MSDYEPWLDFTAKMTRIILEYVEKRKTRRNSGESDS